MHTAAPLVVHFALTPNFLLLDYAGPAEAFRIAARHGAPVEVRSCAATARLACSLGIEVGGLDPLPPTLPPDALVVVCGVADSRVDYDHPQALAVLTWLRERRDDHPELASVCAGALLLARAGLLDGRRCTTHHHVLERLRAAAPAAIVEDNRLFVSDGPVTTSAGITTGIDLALHLLERRFGPALAAAVAREMVVWMRRSGQDPQLSPWLAWRNHLHPAVHRAQDAIAADPARRWTLPALAERAHVSPRHLARLFATHTGISAGEYQQRLRVAHVRRLLEARRLPLEQVAELAGFGSARDLRRVWARYEQQPLQTVGRTA
ncbi:GlxA family transcriptional regulator [Azoarcus olearius]|uniref:Probable AraC family transcriptional regulator n=1 Tax=Azoarcus sp. (strain BH72) TaxID=418699 RepID=A1KC11_AZOSB|nr:helix-turn-helix domain-containing protein [Azoarcus olearius]CAL96367.1 probable AraC family transcriptional regulator [Azoarcus olearius]